MDVKTLTAHELALHAESLSQVLIESVGAGGAIGFLTPLSKDDAQKFWMNSIYPEVLSERRILFVAENGCGIVGTVQLMSRLQPNQPHRCEIAKMMVHPNARRQGIGKALMSAALDTAKALNKNLVTLDTRTGDVAERLYKRLGFQHMGIVPGFALNPDGKEYHSTTYMYKRL